MARRAHARGEASADGQEDERWVSCLSGGGARGAFQVGVYERLLRDPRFAGGPVVLSGTSAGAINAALIAAGKTPARDDALLEQHRRRPAGGRQPGVLPSAGAHDAAPRVARSCGLAVVAGAAPCGRSCAAPCNHMPPQRGSFAGAVRRVPADGALRAASASLLEGIREPFVADTARLRARLVEEFGGEVVPHNGHRLAINTVDAHTGHVVRYVTTRTPLTRPPDYIVVDAITVDMIMASASIPLLFPPVEIGGRYLWDGGLLVNTPLAPVVALGRGRDRHRAGHRAARCEARARFRISAAPSSAPSMRSSRTPTTSTASCCSIATAWRTSKSSPYREVTLYDAVRPARDGSFNAGSYLYFERGVLDGHAQGGSASRHCLARRRSARRSARTRLRRRSRVARVPLQWPRWQMCWWSWPSTRRWVR